LRQHRLSPEVCHPAAERAATGETAQGPGAATRGELRAGDVGHFDGGVGSGRLSVVGAIESAVAGVDAVDTQTLSNASGDREAG